MSKRGSNISKVFFFAFDKTFCSNSWILIQSLHPILFHSAIYAHGVVQTLQEIVKTNLKTPLINDSQTLSHLLRRLACGNLKLVQNWYKVAVQNVQNIKVTIVNMQMQCFAVIEWMKFQWSHRCNCFFWGGRGMPLHRTACLLGTKKWWLKWHFQALNSSNHACIMACKLLSLFLLCHRILKTV